MKQKFDIITSNCVPLPLENVDTDQIIPALFLKATTCDEKFFGDNLFRDWRYLPDGSLNKDFVLNNPLYGGQILVAGMDSEDDVDRATELAVAQANRDSAAKRMNDAEAAIAVFRQQYCRQHHVPLYQRY